MTRANHGHIEDDHQKAIMQWARSTRLKPLYGVKGFIADYMFAIPNGGKRSPREGARLKAQGVLAGVPDMMLAIPRGQYSGLFIELKRPKVQGKPNPSTSIAQQEMIIKLNEVGYLAVVCYGYDQTVTCVNDYLNNRFQL